jgi:hypothetical protein
MIHVGDEEMKMTSEPEGAKNVTLSQLREQQKQEAGPSSPYDPNVEASRKWLRDLESQRNDLFITLCAAAELDEDECQEAVLLAKKNESNLREACAEDVEDANWTVESLEQVPSLIKRYTWACQRQIALLDIELGLLFDQLDAAESKYQSTPEGIRSFLLLPIRVEKEAASLLDILSRGCQYLGAIRVLKRRDAFVNDRRRGNAASNRKPKKSDYQSLVTAMVKIVYQLEPPKNANSSRLELSEKYATRIMEIWRAWPFFPLDIENLTDLVDAALGSFDLPIKNNKVLFKNRVRKTMTRFSHDESLANVSAKEALFKACEAKQAGMIDALVHVMESKFGELAEGNIKLVEEASPLQLLVWLRCVHDVDAADELLSISSNRIKK